MHDQNIEQDVPKRSPTESKSSVIDTTEPEDDAPSELPNSLTRTYYRTAVDKASVAVLTIAQRHQLHAAKTAARMQHHDTMSNTTLATLATLHGDTDKLQSAKAIIIRNSDRKINGVALKIIEKIRLGVDGSL